MSVVVLCNVDTAGGGTIRAANPARHLRVGGFVVAVVGDLVDTHGTGNDEHKGKTMRGGNGRLKVNGSLVCVLNSQATCDHPATASGNRLTVA